MTSSNVNCFELISFFGEPMENLINLAHLEIEPEKIREQIGITNA